MPQGIEDEWWHAQQRDDDIEAGVDPVEAIAEYEAATREQNWNREYANRTNRVEVGDIIRRFALTSKERFEVQRIIREEMRAAYTEVFFENGQLPETDHEGTPRWEFEQQFGPITAEQWEWLKEFCRRNPGTRVILSSGVERPQAPADPGD